MSEPILEYDSSSTSNVVEFRKFENLEYTESIGELLEQNNIAYQIENTSAEVMPLMPVNDPRIEYTIKIQRKDLTKAEEILASLSQREIENIGTDYYLYEFSDDELVEVIEKKDEWGTTDILLAEKILKERGVTIDDQYKNKLNQKRYKELAEPEVPQTSWLIAGYAFALIGGLIGIAIGWILMTTTKTLPTGESVHAYNSNDRAHGKRIFTLGIILGSIWTILSLVRLYHKLTM